MPALLNPLLSMLEALRITDSFANHPRFEWPNGILEYGDGTDRGSIFTVPSTNEQGLRHTVMPNPALVLLPTTGHLIEDFQCDCPEFRQQAKPCDHIWDVVLRHWDLRVTHDVLMQYNRFSRS